MFESANGKTTAFPAIEEGITQYAVGRCPLCDARVLCLPDVPGIGIVILADGGETLGAGVARCRCGTEISWTLILE